LQKFVEERELLKKAEGRGQRAEGIPINKFRGFNKDTLNQSASAVSVQIFLGSPRLKSGASDLKASGKTNSYLLSPTELESNSSSQAAMHSAPSALCPLPFSGEAVVIISNEGQI